MCALPLEHEIEYPTSDGQPMAETTLHREVMSDIIGGLERRYADVPDVWVGGNLFPLLREGESEEVGFSRRAAGPGGPEVAPGLLLPLGGEDPGAGLRDHLPLDLRRR